MSSMRIQTPPAAVAVVIWWLVEVRLELASIHAPGSDHTMGRRTQPAKDRFAQGRQA
jgi:hypothetical protein